MVRSSRPVQVPTWVVSESRGWAAQLQGMSSPDETVARRRWNRQVGTWSKHVVIIGAAASEHTAAHAAFPLKALAAASHQS